MNAKPFAGKYFIPAVLLACFSIALIAWGGQQKNPRQKPGQTITDTVPKNKSDKKVRDLDDALDELNKADFRVEIEKAKKEMEEAMKKIDMAKIKADVDKAMKAVDMEKIKAEIDQAIKAVDMEKIKAEIAGAMKEVDAAKIEQEIKASMAKVDWEKMKVEMESIKKIDMSNVEAEMKKVQEEMKELGPKIEKELEKAKVEIEKAKEELKEYKSFVDGLEKDGLINKKENYTIEHKNGELIINGKKQPAEVYNKYRSFLEKHKKFSIKKTDDDFNMDNDD